MPATRRGPLTTGSFEALAVSFVWDCVNCVADLELRGASRFVYPITWSLYLSGNEQVSLKPGRYPLSIPVLGSPGGSFSLRIDEASPAGMESVSVRLGRTGSKGVRRALRVDRSLRLAAPHGDLERYIDGAPVPGARVNDQPSASAPLAGRSEG